MGLYSLYDSSSISVARFIKDNLVNCTAHERSHFAKKFSSGESFRSLYIFPYFLLRNSDFFDEVYVWLIHLLTFAYFLLSLWLFFTSPIFHHFAELYWRLPCACIAVCSAKAPI